LPAPKRSKEDRLNRLRKKGAIFDPQGLVRDFFGLRGRGAAISARRNAPILIAFLALPETLPLLFFL